MAFLPEFGVTCTEAEELRSDRTGLLSSAFQRSAVGRVTEALGGRPWKSEWLSEGRKFSAIASRDHGLRQGPEEEAAKLKAKRGGEIVKPGPRS